MAKKQKIKSEIMISVKIKESAYFYFKYLSATRLTCDVF